RGTSRSAPAAVPRARPALPAGAGDRRRPVRRRSAGGGGWPSSCVPRGAGRERERAEKIQLRRGALSPNFRGMTVTPGERLLQRRGRLRVPAVIVMGIVVLRLRARDQLERSPRFMVDPTACSLTSKPNWVSDDLGRFIAFSVSRGLGSRASLLDSRD